MAHNPPTSINFREEIEKRGLFRPFGAGAKSSWLWNRSVRSDIDTCNMRVTEVPGAQAEAPWFRIEFGFPKDLPGEAMMTQDPGEALEAIDRYMILIDEYHVVPDDLRRPFGVKAPCQRLLKDDEPSVGIEVWVPSHDAVSHRLIALEDDGSVHASEPANDLFSALDRVDEFSAEHKDAPSSASGMTP